MKIVDENGAEVRPGEVGEILVSGPNVMKGYLNRPEATAEAVKDGWLHTGDLARLDESGFGFVQVREENVIVKSGFKVFPREIEDLLCQFGKVREAVVVGMPDEKQDEEIHACIVLNQGEQVSPEEIIEYCKSEMAPYKCPSYIHFLESLPKGPTGRLIRGQVKQLLLERTNRETKV